MGLKNRLQEGRGSELARNCREKMRERFKEGRVRLEWKKRRFFAEKDENRGSGKRER